MGAAYALALEKQLEMHRFYTRYEEVIESKPKDAGVFSQITKAIRAFREVTAYVAPIYYAPEMAEIALGALNYFDGSEKLWPADLPDPEGGFLYCDKPLWVGPSIGDSPYIHRVHGYLWRSALITVEDGTSQQGWLLVEYGKAEPTDDGPPNPEDEILWSTVWVASESMDDNAKVWEQGSTTYGWVDAEGGFQTNNAPREEFAKRDAELRRRFLSLMNFMQQKIVTSVSQQAPRAVNRRLPEDWRSRLVQVVALRARQYQRKDTGEEPSYTHTFRHIRRAHWHKYWYKNPDGDYELRPRWVDATVVGPEGAPIKGGAKLFAVVR